MCSRNRLIRKAGRSTWSMHGTIVPSVLLCGLAIATCAVLWSPWVIGQAGQRDTESSRTADQDADEALLEKWLIWLRPDFRVERPSTPGDPDAVRDPQLKTRGLELGPAFEMKLPPLEAPTGDPDPEQ